MCKKINLTPISVLVRNLLLFAGAMGHTRRAIQIHDKKVEIVHSYKYRVTFFFFFFNI